LWNAIEAEYELSVADQTMLKLACEALDRAEQARLILAAEGLVTGTDKGHAKSHPAVIIERDARAAAARLLTSLGLEPPPPSMRSSYPGVA
jgi:P27 family predicted phage terminase small subunit